MQPLAQKALSSETTSIICALNPLTAAGLGWLFLGMTWVTWDSWELCLFCLE